MSENIMLKKSGIAMDASLIGIEDEMSLYNATNVETALAEVMDKVTPVTYLGDSIATPTGAVTAGDVDSTKVLNVDSYDVTEVTGSPGFDIRITYQGIVTGHEPNRIQLHIAYNGSVAHVVNLELWNYTGTPQFDVIAADFIIESGGNFIFYDIDIPGQITDYVSGSGEAILRFNHTSAGNINHDFLIDFAALKDAGSGVGGITEHGALSGLQDDDHLLYLLHDGTRVMTGNLDMGTNDIINSPTLSNHPHPNVTTTASPEFNTVKLFDFSSENYLTLQADAAGAGVSLTFDVNSGNRVLDIKGPIVFLDNWFNQNVMTVATPTFSRLTITHLAGMTSTVYVGIGLDGYDGTPGDGSDASSNIFTLGDGGTAYGYGIGGDGGGHHITLGAAGPGVGGAGEDGNFIITNLPTSDPSVSGALWSDSGTIKISA